MSNVTLMAGTPQILCRAWHALNERDRKSQGQCRAPGCPEKGRADPAERVAHKNDL